MIEKITAAVKKAKASGITPWAYTPEGKAELEEIKARKEKNRHPSKENTPLFMGDLETGLDENAE